MEGGRMTERERERGEETERNKWRQRGEKAGKELCHLEEGWERETELPKSKSFSACVIW